MSDRPKSVLVAGGAGFLGTHLCEALVQQGVSVVSVDNYVTSHPVRSGPLLSTGLFRHFSLDICDRAQLVAALETESFRCIINLASPASPPAYTRLAVETLSAGSIGMKNLLDLAVTHRALIFQASTSEVYGDPAIHPQPETYWGNVNPVGPRSMYDESKRFAEALCAAYEKSHGLEVRMARIFNTYGPGMSPHDGRVVTNFIGQALRNDPITIFGDGAQTRSFCYADDMVDGILKLVASSLRGPVNIGNPNEFTMLELADVVRELTGSKSTVTFAPLPGDDPLQRRPDITRARTELGWEPRVQLREGLTRTIAWFRSLPEFQ